MAAPNAVGAPVDDATMARVLRARVEPDPRDMPPPAVPSDGECGDGYGSEAAARPRVETVTVTGGRL